MGLERVVKMEEAIAENLSALLEENFKNSG